MFTHFPNSSAHTMYGLPQRLEDKQHRSNNPLLLWIDWKNFVSFHIKYYIGYDGWVGIGNSVRDQKCQAGIKEWDVYKKRTN